jgi:probable HAF family extracellular repeat protein
LDDRQEDKDVIARRQVPPALETMTAFGPSLDASFTLRAFLWHDGVMTDLNTSRLVTVN